MSLITKIKNAIFGKQKIPPKALLDKIRAEEFSTLLDKNRESVINSIAKYASYKNEIKLDINLIRRDIVDALRNELTEAGYTHQEVTEGRNDVYLIIYLK